jgi:hypothetical protein
MGVKFVAGGLQYPEADYVTHEQMIDALSFLTNFMSSRISMHMRTAFTASALLPVPPGTHICAA